MINPTLSVILGCSGRMVVISNRRKSYRKMLTVLATFNGSSFSFFSLLLLLSFFLFSLFLPFLLGGCLGWRDKETLPRKGPCSTPSERWVYPGRSTCQWKR